MLLTAAAGADCAILSLYPASGRFDFLPRPRAHLDAAHCDTLRRVSVRQKLGWSFPAADHSRLDQSLLRHFSPLRQSCQIVEADDLMFYTKDISETALGHTPSYRHLATLELRFSTTRSVVTRARLDTFVSLTRRLTGARARTASKSLPIPMRARCWNQVVQAYFFHAGFRVGAAAPARCLGFRWHLFSPLPASL